MLPAATDMACFTTVGLTQRDVLDICSLRYILEVLEHLGLVGVLDLEPFTLCVISGGCLKIYLKHSRWMQAVRAVLWNGDGAAVGEGYENLVLIGRVVMRDEWS